MLTIREERVLLRQTINSLIAEISMLKKFTVGYSYTYTDKVLKEATAVLAQPVDKDEVQLHDVASSTLDFISKLLSVEPNDATDLLTNFGDDVEDRLIEVLSHYHKKEEYKGTQRIDDYSVVLTDSIGKDADLITIKCAAINKKTGLTHVGPFNEFYKDGEKWK